MMANAQFGMLCVLVMFAGWASGCAGYEKSVEAEGKKPEKVVAAAEQKAPTARRLWTSEFNYQELDCMPVVRRGFVYVGVNADAVCFKKVDVVTGKEAWAVPGEKVNRGGVEVYGNVVVYGSGNMLKGRDEATGKELWATKLDGEAYGTAPGVNGVLYAVTDKGDVYAVTPKDGKVRWQANVEGPLSCLPVMYRDEMVAVVTESGVAHVLAQENGSRIWRIELGGPARTQPVVYQRYMLVGIGDGNYDGAKTMMAVSLFDGEVAQQWESLHGWSQEVLVDEDCAYLRDMTSLVVIDPTKPGVLWEYPDEFDHLGLPVFIGSEVVLPFKNERNRSKSDHVVSLRRRGGELVAREEKGAIPIFDDHMQYGRWGDVMVVMSGEKLEAWRIGAMKPMEPSVKGAEEEAWSAVVNEMQGRLVVRVTQAANGQEKAELFLVLRTGERNVQIDYASLWGSLCVIDAEGNEVQPKEKWMMNRLGALEPKEVILPFRSELWLNLGGLGFWDGLNWKIPADGKDYWFQMVLGVPETEADRQEVKPWAGRLDLPAVKAPRAGKAGQ